MNWEMTLQVERNKGRAEGKAEGMAEGRAEGMARGKIEGRTEGKTLKLIQLVLTKTLRGQSAECIAEDLVEDPAVVRTIVEIASALPDPSAEDVYDSYVKIRQE